MAKPTSNKTGEKESSDFPPPFRLSEGYRPRCFFDIQINKVDAGRLVFELFNDICPRTAENFRALCTGEKGEGKTTSKPLHYKNCILHRIVKNFVIQGGDFVSGDGTGGESIYGGQFKDENFDLHHDRPFLLSMANCGANTNGSQFFITLAASHHLDNVHTVFGHLVDGHDIVRDMENQKVSTGHKPYADIRIAHCGELVKKAKTSTQKTKSKSTTKKSESSSSESDDSDLDHRKKRKQKEKKSSEKKKKTSPPKEVATEKEVEPGKDDLNFIPSVPLTFLMRRSRTPSPLREKRRQEGLSDTRRREPVLRTRINMVSKSGKKLRGRGVMRYRTPSPESDSGENTDRDVPLTEADSNREDNKDLKDDNMEDKRMFLQRSRPPPPHDYVEPRNKPIAETSLDRPPKPRQRSRSPGKSFIRRRSKSRSRSREFRRRRRSRSLSKSRRDRRERSRSRQRHPRRRSRSRSPNSRYRRSPSYDRRPRRRRSGSRSRKLSTSPVRYHKREPSPDKKGKFERHQSDSDSDSSQERKTKIAKAEEINKQNETETNVDTSVDKSQEKTISVVPKIPDIEQVLPSTIMPYVDTVMVPPPIEKKDAIDTSKNEELKEMVSEEEKFKGLLDESKDLSPLKEKETLNPIENELVSEAIEKDEENISKRNEQVDELIATILSESSPLESKVEKVEESSEFIAKADTPNVIEKSKEIQSTHLHQADDHLEDDVIKQSKEKIDELQEKIREFKQFNLQINEGGQLPTNSDENIVSPMNFLNEDSTKALKKTKYKMDEKVKADLSSSIVINKGEKAFPKKKKGKEKSDSEGEKDSDDSFDRKLSKKKPKKKPPRDSSSESSDDKQRKSLKKMDTKKIKKKVKKKPPTSSSESDEDLDSEDSSSDNESDVEADRDRKRYKKKPKSRKDIDKGQKDVNKQKSSRKKKKYYSDYSSESSEEEKKVKKKYKKKQYTSSDSSSAASSDSEFERSKKKVKTNRQIKDRKRKRKKSIST